MQNADYIPRTDTDFNTWQHVFFHTLSERATDFGVPMAKVMNLNGQQTAWVDAYNLANGPATRTKAIIEQKNEARAAYEKAIRAIVNQYLTYNDAVTNADRDNLGLPIHKTTRTPVPVPATYPGFTIDSGTIRRLIIHFLDQAATGKAKPFGIHGAEIKWGILDAPPTLIEQLIHSAFDTRSPLTLDFEENQRGKTVYFCLRWENTRGQKGPWSEIVSAIVP